MEKNDKELLLKDLCARLPYGVKVSYKYFPDNVKSRFLTGIRLVDNKMALSSKRDREGDWYVIDDADGLLCKPYLRPMEWMTDEEYDELCEYAKLNFIGESKENDWLNKNHFDFRGLIEKGLAFEATEDIYKK